MMSSNWENVVSDDDDSTRNGTLILEGAPAEEELDTVTSSDLDPSKYDLGEQSFQDISALTFSRVSNKLQGEENQEEEEQEEVAFVEEDVVMEGGDTVAFFFGSVCSSFNKKHALVAAASVVFLAISISGIQVWRYINHLESENKEWKEKALALEREKALVGERWTVADNCYYRMDLGDCAIKHMEELNGATKTAWETIEGAWKSATSWPHKEGDDQDSSHHSFEHAFLEAPKAVAHAFSSAANERIKEMEALTNGVTQGVANFVDEWIEDWRASVEKFKETSKALAEENTIHKHLEKPKYTTE